MKRAGKIISLVSAGVLCIVALVFIVIEGRNLFSGDWGLFENPSNGFVRYFFRFLIAIIALSLSIFTYFALKKNAKQIYRIYFYFGVIGLFVSSLVIGYFASNYMDSLFKLVAGFYALGAILDYCGNRFYVEKKNEQ